MKRTSVPYWQRQAARGNSHIRRLCAAPPAGISFPGCDRNPESVVSASTHPRRGSSGTGFRAGREDYACAAVPVERPSQLQESQPAPIQISESTRAAVHALVTSGTFLWRLAVDQNLAAADLRTLLRTGCAGYRAMPAVERKCGRVVIEAGRLPGRGLMTRGAVHAPVQPRKLRCMRVVMA